MRLVAVGGERSRRFRLDASLLPFRAPRGKRMRQDVLLRPRRHRKNFGIDCEKHFVSPAERVCIDRSRRPKLVGKPLEPNSITSAHRGPFFILKNELRNEFCTRNGTIHSKIIINHTPLSGIFKDGHNKKQPLIECAKAHIRASMPPLSIGFVSLFATLHLVGCFRR